MNQTIWLAALGHAVSVVTETSCHWSSNMQFCLAQCLVC